MTGTITIRNDGKVNIRTLYSVFIALFPVIMAYNVPILNKGVSTVLLILLAPYALICFLKKLKKANSYSVFFCVLFFAYAAVRSLGDTITTVCLTLSLLHVLAIFNGAADVRVMRKTIEIIAVFSAGIVLLQSLSYYLFGFRMNLLIEALLLEENKHYAADYLMGLYRPSALFLEPAHYTQYCCVGLISVLFPENSNRANIKKALWITLGCLLTTSGMGIVLCGCGFAYYALFCNRHNKRKFIRSGAVIILGVAAFAVLMQFSFFSQAVQRITGEVDGYNAIWGRTLFWDRYIGTMHGRELLIGKGSLNLPSGYMTGLMSLIYQYGIISLLLLALLLFMIAVKGRDRLLTCLVVMYAGLLFVANKTGFISLVFYFGLFAAICYEKRKNVGDYICVRREKP